MINKEAAKIVFRRIHGRIVPIALGALNGALNGELIGQVAGSLSAHKDRKILQQRMQEHTVDAKKYVKSTGLKDIHVITSRAELKPHFSFISRYLGGMNAAVDMANKGHNAFALQHKGKDFVVVGKKSNPEVLGHELGHIKDFRINGFPKFSERAFGSLSGATLAREKAAWALSPYKKSSSTMHPALNTYKKSQFGARTGAVIGAGLGAIAGLLETHGD